MKTKLSTFLGVLCMLVLLVGCGSSDTASEDGAGSGAAAVDEGAPADSKVAVDRLQDKADQPGADAGTGEADDDNRADPISQPAVISTGRVSVRGTDPDKLRLDILEIVSGLDGLVADESTKTNRKGEIVFGTLQVRVPSAQFEQAMADLGKVGDLVSTSRSSEDVTTQVVDVAARIRAQEKGLSRIEALLAQAKSLSEIIAIEAQLTQRQADLDSLKSQRAWLADQTSLSTIKITFRETSEVNDRERPDNAFVRGLKSGWTSLSASAETLVVIFAALLPYALVLGLLAWPVLAWRRRGRSSENSTVEGEPSKETVDA